METQIVVAGGHSKASAALLARKGSHERWRVIDCRTTRTGLNSHLEDETDLGDTLRTLIAFSPGDTDITPRQIPLSKTTLSLPGAATPDDQEAITRMLRSKAGLIAQIRILDDTWAGLIAGLANCVGVCAFAGTGASVFVGLGEIQPERTHKIDGWGAFLGDRGSGFQMSMSVLRGLTRAQDRGETLSPLGHHLVSSGAISRIEGLQTWFDEKVINKPRSWNIEIAKLAPFIIKFAEAGGGDVNARSHVLRAAEQMAESILLATKRFCGATPLPIVFQGGMFEHSSLYRKEVNRIVREHYRGEVGMAESRPLYGALLYALLPDGTDPNPENFSSAKSKIQGIPREFRDFFHYTKLANSLECR